MSRANWRPYVNKNYRRRLYSVLYTLLSTKTTRTKRKKKEKRKKKKKMVLSGVVPEMFFYGALGTIFTHSTYFSAAVAMILWISGAAFFIHRNDEGLGDPGNLIMYYLNIILPGSLWLGTLVGHFFIGSLRTPRLIDTRVFFSDGSWSPRYHVWTTVWIFGALIAAIPAGYFLLQFYGGPNELTVAQQNVWGALIISVALIVVLIASCVLYTRGSRSRRQDLVRPRQNLKYLFLMAVLMVIPALYDYPQFTIRPYQGFILLGALPFIYIGAYLYSTRLGRTNDLAFGVAVPLSWARLFWIALFLLNFTVYLAGWLADTYSSVPTFDDPGDPVTVFAATVGIVVAWLIALPLLGCCFFRGENVEARQNSTLKMSNTASIKKPSSSSASKKPFDSNKMQWF